MVSYHIRVFIFYFPFYSSVWDIVVLANVFDPKRSEWKDEQESSPQSTVWICIAHRSKRSSSLSLATLVWKEAWNIQSLNTFFFFFGHLFGSLLCCSTQKWDTHTFISETLRNGNLALDYQLFWLAISFLVAFSHWHKIFREQLKLCFYHWFCLFIGNAMNHISIWIASVTFLLFQVLFLQDHIKYYILNKTWTEQPIFINLTCLKM